MSTDPPNHAVRLQEMLRGYYVSQALYMAARLGIADLLAPLPGREAGAEELARASGTDADSLYRFLRALASEGVFEERAGRRFALNEMAAALRRDVPGTMLPAALMAGEMQYKVWTQLKETLKPGATSGFERIFRQPLFTFFGEHPEFYATFNAVMAARVGPIRAALLEACVVRDGDMVVDIGGGLGSILAGVLERYPAARGTLLETPAVIEEARGVFAGSPLKDRVKLVAGDCLAAVPAGDVMILVTVLHMFQDAGALRILRNCRGALAAGGRLYIAEALLRGPNEKDAGKWQDLNMMLMTGGRERTFDEFAELLREAGFGRVVRKGEIIEAHTE